MDLIYLVIGIALAGFLVYLVTTYIPMEPIFKTIIYVVIAIALVLFIVRQFAGTVPNVMR